MMEGRGGRWGLRPGPGFHISTTLIGCRVEDSGFGVWVLGCRVRAFYGRHALPMLELYREKKDGWRVGAASNRAGKVGEYLLI